MAAVKPPLGPVQLPIILDAIDTLNNAQLELDRAKRAGIDVSAQQSQKDDQLAKLLAIKAAYFPGQ